jgi:hypothetical protein
VSEQTERKHQRRHGGPIDSPVVERRRVAYERRGTVPQEAPPTREQQLFGERRQNPKAR